MVCEKTYQKACWLTFRMNINEIVFNQFQIDSLELIKDGVMVYYLRRRQTKLTDIPIVSNDPIFEGFLLINQKDFTDCNLFAKPNRRLACEKTFYTDLIKL